jgi:hypothetical protein
MQRFVYWARKKIVSTTALGSGLTHLHLLSRNHAEEIENWRSTVGLGTLLV